MIELFKSTANSNFIELTICRVLSDPVTNMFIFLSTESSEDGKLSSTESTESNDGGKQSSTESTETVLAIAIPRLMKLTVVTLWKPKKPNDGVGRSCKHNQIVFVTNPAILLVQSIYSKSHSVLVFSHKIFIEYLVFPSRQNTILLPYYDLNLLDTV